MSDSTRRHATARDSSTRRARGRSGSERRESECGESSDLRTDGGERDLVGTVEDGWLFELAYRADGERRTHLVRKGPPPHPPLEVLKMPPRFVFHGVRDDERHRVTAHQLEALAPVELADVPDSLVEPAVAGLLALVEAAPACVSLAQVRTALATVARSDSTPADAVRLAIVTLREREGGFEAVGAEALGLARATDHDVGRGVLQGFVLTARDDPGRVAPFATDLATLAADSAHRADAVRCLAALAEADPTDVLDAVPALATAVESAERATREWAAYALSLVADEHPSAVLPAVDALVDATRAADQSTRTNALAALGRVARSRPDAAAPVTADLVDLLADDADAVRSNVVGLLADVARWHPSTVVEHAGPIADCLDAPDARTRVHASIALLNAGEANPPAVRERSEQVVAALDDPNPAVRANACTLAGNVRASTALETLRDLRERDPDESVREQAARAVSRLS